MSINIDWWGARIESFIQKIGTVRTGSTRYYRYLSIINYKVMLFFLILLLTNRDIEANPRPTEKIFNYISCLRWNVNLAHNKIFVLIAYNLLVLF